jgi:hypothetical protein
VNVRDSDPQLALSPWYLRASMVSVAVIIIGVSLWIAEIKILGTQAILSELAGGLTGIGATCSWIFIYRFVHYRRMGY